MKCPNCGNVNPDNAERCFNCGVAFVHVKNKPKMTKKSKIIISSISVIIIVILLLIYLLSPSLSPIASIRDTDGDGHADSNDVFPDDRLEWADADSDGVGDNADFFDQGNGKILIKITSYVGDETADFWTWGDPQFDVLVDVDADGEPDDTYSSQVYLDTESLTNPYSVTIDLPDNATVFEFSIWVWDSDTDDTWEIIDYTPSTSNTDYIHTVEVPFSESWTYDGNDDGIDEIDCILSYSVSLAI